MIPIHCSNDLIPEWVLLATLRCVESRFELFHRYLTWVFGVNLTKGLYEILPWKQLLAWNTHFHKFWVFNRPILISIYHFGKYFKEDFVVLGRQICFEDTLNLFNRQSSILVGVYGLKLLVEGWHVLLQKIERIHEGYEGPVNRWVTLELLEVFAKVLTKLLLVKDGLLSFAEDPRMIEQLLCSGSLFAVYDQALLDEVFALLWYITPNWLVHSKFTFLNQWESLISSFCIKRLLSTDKFIDYNSQRPNINLAAILLTVDDFGCHVKRCAQNLSEVVFALYWCFWKSKIYEFELKLRERILCVSLWINNVFRFQISMHYIMFVQIVQSS